MTGYCEYRGQDCEFFNECMGIQLGIKGFYSKIVGSLPPGACQEEVQTVITNKLGGLATDMMVGELPVVFTECPFTEGTEIYICPWSLLNIISTRYPYLAGEELADLRQRGVVNLVQEVSQDATRELSFLGRFRRASKRSTRPKIIATDP